MTTKLTDKCKMPFGMYIHRTMANVPAHYLLWLGEKIKLTHEKNRSLNKKLVLKYIEENKEVLEKQKSQK